MYAKTVLMTAAILLSGHVYAQSTTAPSAKATTKKKDEKVVEAKKEIAPATAVITPTPSSSKVSDVIKYMREKFSASYHGEYYLVRRDALSPLRKENDIQDIKIMHNPTVIYKPTKDWQVLATSEFKYSDVDGLDTSFPNTFFRALFTLTRKNILSEKIHGLTMDAGIGRRQFNTGIAALSSYGNNRVFTTLTKGKGSLFVQYLQNDYKHPSATTWKHSAELIPTYTFQLSEKMTWLINDDIVINTPHHDNTARSFSITHEMNVGYINYQWNDKDGTYFQLKYYHSENFTKAPQSKDDYFEYYIGWSHSFSPKATLTGEIGTEMFHARDGKDFLSEKFKYPELALYMDFSL
ncbi:MAG: hypothetical protein WC635_13955 [Bacteriovorax sp.]|jgi:hypothetical protein